MTVTQAVADGPFRADLDWKDWPPGKGNAYLQVFRTDPRAPGFDVREDTTDRIPKMRVRAIATDLHGNEFDCLWTPTGHDGWCEVVMPFGESREMLPITVVPRATTRVELMPTLEGPEMMVKSLFVRIEGENDSDLSESASVGMLISTVAGVLGILGTCALLLLAWRPFRSGRRGRDQS